VETPVLPALGAKIAAGGISETILGLTAVVFSNRALFGQKELSRKWDVCVRVDAT
jgi:hypothetical protein